MVVSDAPTDWKCIFCHIAHGGESALTTRSAVIYEGPSNDLQVEYPAAACPSPGLALRTVLGDWGGTVGAYPALRTARDASRHGPVYAYGFQQDSGLVHEGFPLGAFHGWELPYLFDPSMPNGYPDLVPDHHCDFWAAG